MVVKIAEIIAKEERGLEWDCEATEQAKARLASDPVDRWREALAKHEARVTAATEALAAAESDFAEASRAVAGCERSADRKQDNAHEALTAARAELEKGRAARDLARRELEISAGAAGVIRHAEYIAKQRKSYHDAQERAREALKAHEANLAALCKSHAALRDSLCDVATFYGYGTGRVLDSSHPLNDVDFAMKVVYASALPVKWALGQYDFLRAGQQGADAITDPAPAQTFTGAFAHHIEG